MNRAFRLVALTLSLAALPAAAAWKVTDLGRPDDATFQIRIAAINDKGEIAGGVWRHGTTTIPVRSAFVRGKRGFTLFGETTIGPPTIAKDINKAGVVTGVASAPFTWDGGVMTTLSGVPPSSIANTINDHGVVAGAMPVTGGEHAFAWSNGLVADLGTLGGPYSQAFGINKRGDVVGESQPFGSVFPHAFLLPEGGAMADLGTLPGGAFSNAYAINHRGDVAGTSAVPGSQKHAVLWQDGTISDLGTLPGTQNSDAIGINDRGSVVGISVGFIGTFSIRPFLWRNGQMTDLSALPELADAGFTSWVLHGELVGAVDGEGPGIAINNRGQIAGVGIKGGRETLFVLSPDDEGDTDPGESD